MTLKRSLILFLIFCINVFELNFKIVWMKSITWFTKTSTHVCICRTTNYLFCLSQFVWVNSQSMFLPENQSCHAYKHRQPHNYFSVKHGLVSPAQNKDLMKIQHHAEFFQYLGAQSIILVDELYNSKEKIVFTTQ